ncbi:hypothetical protein T440DRAFT_399656 [Plenodomus tracheiphilus IPT5]|uniref:Uncharacterized protein n=1 Tax=Plenodomus tracheiphilus IPT5 TaxID=1408161 RepID=A0A6A7B1B7_9PLEO|nr:hypothetical protein T440DRAFT_399656 [Plenodomus tracheiphilus IPT5]
MIDVPPQSPSRPARLRNSSQSHPSSINTVSSIQTALHGSSFSLLLSLPRELRDRIYTAALTAPYLFSWPGKPPAKVRYDVNVSLLRVNRQVHDEAVAILYSQNKLLFTHPSDLNIFRVIASPASQSISSVYFRIREKDLRLWTAYLSSKNPERSLKADLPKLKSLWLFMRCGSMGAPGMLGQLGNGGVAHGGQAVAPLPAALHMQAQQLQMQQQAPGGPFAAHAPQLVAANPQNTQNNNVPPPPPPAPVPFIQFAQGVLGLGGHANPHGQNNNNNNHNHNHNHNHTPQNPYFFTIGPARTPAHLAAAVEPEQPSSHPLYTSFLRFEREMGIEWLCLSLQDTLTSSSSTATAAESRPEVKIVCIMRIPRREVDRLARLYPEELSVDRHGDARTRFWKMRGLEVSLEFSGYPVPGEGNVEGDGRG